MAYRAGAKLLYMDSVQYHPTGLPNTGILLTEGCRGEGGILVAGRWHERGVRIVYTVGSKALGVLEYLAHLTTGSTPFAAAWWWLDLDEARTEVEAVDPKGLPARWNGVRHASATRALGTRWIRERRTEVRVAPSVVARKAGNSSRHQSIQNPRRSRPGHASGLI